MTLFLANKAKSQDRSMYVINFSTGIHTFEITAASGKQKQSGTTFNSLVIGQCFLYERMRQFFDREWVYDPHSSNIQELINFTRP